MANPGESVASIAAHVPTPPGHDTAAWGAHDGPCNGLRDANVTAREAVLELVGLGKDYGARTAVHAVDLTLSRGEIFGLLGPNGAGKTTTISMACGVVAPSRGTARIAGADIRTQTFAAKRAIGLVPQDLAL